MAIKGSKAPPRRGNPGPTAYTLDDVSLDVLKDQILLVLADYRNMEAERFHTEGTRIEIAKRIIDNLKATAAS